METNFLQIQKEVFCIVCDEVASYECMQCKVCAAPVCKKCVYNWEQQNKGQLICIYGCILDPKVPFKERFIEATHEKLKRIQNATVTCQDCSQVIKAKHFKKHQCSKRGENGQSPEQAKLQQYIVNQQRMLANLQQTVETLQQNKNIPNIQLDQQEIRQIVENKVSLIAKESDWIISRDNWFKSVILPRTKMTIDQRKILPEFQQYRVLYRMSEDGSSNKTFHLKVDNCPNTLTLIQANDKAIFGGFTTIPWKSPQDQVYAMETIINEQQANNGRRTSFTLENPDSYQQMKAFEELSFLPTIKDFTSQKVQKKVNKKGNKPGRTPLQELQTFVFSFSDGIKKRSYSFQLSDTNRAVGHWINWGPCFGGQDIVIDLDCHINSQANLGKSFREFQNTKDDKLQKNLSSFLSLGPIWAINDVEVIEIA